MASLDKKRKSVVKKDGTDHDHDVAIREFMATVEERSVAFGLSLDPGLCNLGHVYGYVEDTKDCINLYFDKNKTGVSRLTDPDDKGNHMVLIRDVQRWFWRTFPDPKDVSKAMGIVERQFIAKQKMHQYTVPTYGQYFALLTVLQAKYQCMTESKPVIAMKKKYGISSGDYATNKILAVKFYRDKLEPMIVGEGPKVRAEDHHMCDAMIMFYDWALGLCKIWKPKIDHAARPMHIYFVDKLDAFPEAEKPAEVISKSE